jgi:capsular polysaccharide transport system permease protein
MARPNRRFRTSRTILALLLREMETTHGRARFGYLWAVGEPVAGILLLTLIFSIAFTAPPVGTSFAYFYASGFLPFMAYLEISQRVSQAIRFSRPLLFYPGVTFLDALAARFLLAATTQLVVFAVVLSLVVGLFSVDVILRWEALGLGLAMAAALGLGVGALNCLLGEIFPSWERVWAILTRPMFLLSTIVFQFETVPEPWRGWLWWNPLVHVVGQVRIGLFATYDGAYVSPGYVLGLAALALAAGLLFLGRYHRDIVNG